MSHISSGVKILSEVHANKDGKQCHSALTLSPYPYVDLKSLEVFFTRLDAGVAQVSQPTIDIRA